MACFHIAGVRCSECAHLYEYANGPTPYCTGCAALREENARLIRERDDARAELANCHCLLQSCHAAVDPEAYPELSEKLSAALECDLPQCQHVVDLEAEVARLEGLILDWSNGVNFGGDALDEEARRIRAQREEGR